MAIIYNTNSVKSGLLVFLDGANPRSYSGAGTTWTDLSGNGINGTIVGSPTFTANNFTITSDSTYVSIPNTTLSPGTGDFTYSSWVLFNAFDTYDTIFENGSYPDSLLLRYESGAGGITVYAENALQGTFTSLGLVANTWYNIVLVRQSGTTSLYVNNTLRGTPFTMNTNISIAAANLLLMRSQHTTTQFTSGRISMFSVYNRALSVNEINQNFNAFRGRYGV